MQRYEALLINTASTTRISVKKLFRLEGSIRFYHSIFCKICVFSHVWVQITRLYTGRFKIFHCDWLGSDLRIGHFFSFHCQLVNTPQLNTQLLNSLTTALKDDCLTNESFWKSKSKSHCDWQSVSQSVLVSSPIWGSWPDIYYCLTVTVVSMWGALSDERTGLSFVRVSVCGSSSFVIM
jgi:hypothetical protein